MKAWSLVVLGLFFFVLSTSFAQEKPYQISVRSEESRWIVELISTTDDGWPEVSEQKSFSTRLQAQAYKNQLIKSRAFLFVEDKEFSAQTVAGTIWPTTQAWSEDWEKRYAAWIEAEVDADFFLRNNIATDCADVAYALRWIFSRINGLPAANYISGTKVLLTNESLRSEWSRLPTDSDWRKDKRFLAVLNYVLRLTYTHTLWKDSFPVALNPQALLSGSYHLNLHDSSGHTQVIHWLGPQSGVPFLTLNSTVPRQVRTLMDSVLFAEYPVVNKSALLRFRWPVKTSKGFQLKSANEMPGYSTEQFQVKSDKDFVLFLFEKLGFTGDRQSLMDYLYKDVLEMMQARIQIVNEGFNFCQKTNCAPGSQGWEDWGTPSRDSRLMGKINTLQSIAGGDLNTGSYAKTEVLQTEAVSWNLAALIWNWKSSNYSSDPRDSVTKRWGAGNQSWLQDQIDSFKALLNERWLRLQKGNEICQKQNCDYSSAGWIKNNVDDLDATLAKRVAYLRGDKFLPATLLQSLESRQNDVIFEVRGQKLSWRHFFDNRVNMNSSPVVSVERQWGLQNKKPVVRVGSMSVNSYYDQWLWDEGKGLLLDRQSGQVIELGGKVIQVFHQQPVVIVRTAQSNELVHLMTGQRKELPRAFWGATIQVGSSDRFIVYKTQNNIEIFDLDFQQFTVKPVFHLVDSKSWYLIANFNVLSNSEGGVFDLLYNRVVLKRGGGVIAGDDKRLVLSSGSDITALDRATLQSMSLSNPQNEMIGGLDPQLRYVILTDAKNSRLLSLGPQLEILSEQRISGFCWSLKAPFTFCRSDKVGYYFEYENGKFHLLKTGDGVSWADKNSYIVQGFGTAKLYQQGTNKILLEGKSIFSMGKGIFAVVQESGMVHAFYDKDFKQPAMTNLFNQYNGGYEEKQDGILLNSYSSSEHYFWKTEIR